MAIDLVPIWAAIMALAVFMYVLLDGFDLGRGNVHDDVALRQIARDFRQTPEIGPELAQTRRGRDVQCCDGALVDDASGRQTVRCLEAADGALQRPVEHAHAVVVGGLEIARHQQALAQKRDGRTARTGLKLSIGDRLPAALLGDVRIALDRLFDRVQVFMRQRRKTLRRVRLPLARERCILGLRGGIAA